MTCVASKKRGERVLVTPAAPDHNRPFCAKGHVMAEGQSTATFCGVPLDVLQQRLLDRLTRTPAGCWEWGGSQPGGTGYGNMNVRNGIVRGTHRVSYAVFCGPIPDGMFVCYRCDNRLCCNPTHLFLGTATDNARDMVMNGLSCRCELQCMCRLTATDFFAIR